MTTAMKRLELRIDVGDLLAQQALVRSELTPPELVAAVLQEFRELDHLSDQGEQYCLVRRESGAPLDEQQPLGAQLRVGDHLALVERQAPPPAGAARPAQALYLRERASGRVYRLEWLPALIGRPDSSLPDSELIAVDLSHHAAGQRVSRRHARIAARAGQYTVERLSSNPTALVDSAGRTIAVGEEPLPIQHGDSLLLERSQIALTLIVREHSRQKEDLP